MVDVNPRLIIEVSKIAQSIRPNHDIELLVRSFAQSLHMVTNGKIYENPTLKFPDLKTCVDKIGFVLANCPNEKPFLVENFLSHAEIFVYSLIPDEPYQEELEDDEETGNSVVASHHWSLPNLEFDDLWENLIFDSTVKENIVGYAETMLRFSDHGINPNIVTSNRLILFHGPPGTGKTTLSKAVAQKLAVRFSKRFAFAQLIEINSHSLFSKWFSESGKLVTKMFDKIRELLKNKDCLVFVLVDEIESLTRARQSSMSGNEPADAVRVVNAVLTQLDQLKRYPNVLIITTSNLTDAIDDAFLDRADIKQFVPNPSDGAIYKILHSCIKELQRTSLVANEYIDSKPSCQKLSRILFNISKKCVGMSGRTLRKLPLLSFSSAPIGISTEKFLERLFVVVDEHQSTKGGNSSGHVMSNNDVVCPKASRAVNDLDVEVISTCASLFNEDTSDFE